MIFFANVLWLSAIGPLMYAVWLDYTEGVLPNELTFGATGVLLLAQGLQGQLSAALGGAVLGFGILKTAQWAYRRFRGHDGLGSGDAKLMLALGALTGPWGVVWTIGGGSVLAILFNLPRFLRNWRTGIPLVIPFGPYLLFVALCCASYLKSPELWALVWSDLMKELFNA